MQPETKATLSIKAYYRQPSGTTDIRRLRLPLAAHFVDLRQQIASRFGVEAFALQYLDDESELITLQSDADLREAQQAGELKVVVTSKQSSASEQCKEWEELKSMAEQQLNKLVGWWEEAKATAAKKELPHPILLLLLAPLLLFGCCPLLRMLLLLGAVASFGCCPLWVLPLALASCGSGCCPLMWMPLVGMGWCATNKWKNPRCNKQTGRCQGKQEGKVHAVARSGRPIAVTAVPAVGQRCHLDRGYTFSNLGDFNKPNMLYLMTSNSDKSTASNQVMWTLHTSVPVTAHINFRSQQHAASANAWLHAEGWSINPLMRSTISTGIPNGPYSGPVYSRRCTARQIDLMGSNCKEGTYFVFVEIPAEMPAAAQQLAPAGRQDTHQNQQSQGATVEPAATGAEAMAPATKVEIQLPSKPQEELQQQTQQPTPMQHLVELGHTDQAINKMVLDTCSGDVCNAAAKLQLLQGWVPQMQQLQEMGLNDSLKLSELLLKHQGNTNYVVKELLQAHTK